jgi:hypothetical protein
MTDAVYDSVVSQIVLAAHSATPTTPGGSVQVNHWTIYLRFPQGTSSVQLDMTPEPDTLMISSLASELPNDVVFSLPFPAQKGLTVRDITAEITQKGYEKYHYGPLQLECRYYVYVLMGYFQEQGWIDDGTGRGGIWDAVSQTYDGEGKPMAESPAMTQGIFET